MDKIITVLGYKNFITEMSDAPDWLAVVSVSVMKDINRYSLSPLVYLHI